MTTSGARCRSGPGRRPGRRSHPVASDAVGATLHPWVRQPRVAGRAAGRASNSGAFCPGSHKRSRKTPGRPDCREPRAVRRRPPPDLPVEARRPGRSVPDQESGRRTESNWSLFQGSLMASRLRQGTARTRFLQARNSGRPDAGRRPGRSRGLQPGLPETSRSGPTGLILRQPQRSGENHRKFPARRFWTPSGG